MLLTMILILILAFHHTSKPKILSRRKRGYPGKETLSAWMLLATIPSYWKNVQRPTSNA